MSHRRSVFYDDELLPHVRSKGREYRRSRIRARDVGIPTEPELIVVGAVLLDHKAAVAMLAQDIGIRSLRTIRLHPHRDGHIAREIQGRAVRHEDVVITTVEEGRGAET